MLLHELNHLKKLHAKMQSRLVLRSYVTQKYNSAIYGGVMNQTYVLALAMNLVLRC